jgi:hypothetical protein
LRKQSGIVVVRHLLSFGDQNWSSMTTCSIGTAASGASAVRAVETKHNAANMAAVGRVDMDCTPDRIAALRYTSGACAAYDGGRLREKDRHS